MIPKEHPFNTLPLKNFKLSRHMILSVENLTPYDKYINKTALNRYFKIFYNFNSLKQETQGMCNLCKNKVDSIDKLVLIHCKKLLSSFIRYWRVIRQGLTKLLKSPTPKCSVKFEIRVIEALDNMLIDPEPI